MKTQPLWNISYLVHIQVKLRKICKRILTALQSINIRYVILSQFQHLQPFQVLYPLNLSQTVEGHVEHFEVCQLAQVFHNIDAVLPEHELLKRSKLG